MTLDTQVPIAVKAHMVFVLAALGCVAARAGHHLTGPRVKYLFTYGVGKRTMQSVAFIAHIIDGAFDHVRMVRSVRRMAIVAGICLLVFEGRFFPPFKGIFVAGAADIALFAFEQPLVIAGVGRMTGNAAVIFIPHQMIVG